MRVFLVDHVDLVEEVVHVSLEVEVVDHEDLEVEVEVEDREDQKVVEGHMDLVVEDLVVYGPVSHPKVSSYHMVWGSIGT